MFKSVCCQTIQSAYLQIFNCAIGCVTSKAMLQVFKQREKSASWINISRDLLDQLEGVN